MPRESPPSGNRSSTAKPARTQASTDGRNDGTAASRASASSRSSDEGSSAARYPPRFAASIAPGPPPVATTWSAPSRSPRRAASRNAVGASLQRVAAHHADQPPAGHPVGQGHVHGVVVQRLRHRRVAVVGGLGPGVRAGVERVGVRGRVVEVLGPVEVVEVEVDRGEGQVGHDDRAPDLDPLGVTSGEPAAEEQRARHRSGRPARPTCGAGRRRGSASRAATWPRRRGGGRSRPGCRPRPHGPDCASRPRT